MKGHLDAKSLDDNIIPLVRGVGVKTEATQNIGLETEKKFLSYQDLSE